MGLMALGTVVVQGGRGMRNQAAAVRGDAHAMIEDLDNGGRVARLQFLAYQLIRHAVIMPLDLDVIVDVRTDLLPPCQDVALHRQRSQRGLVQLCKRLALQASRRLRKGRRFNRSSKGAMASLRSASAKNLV